MNGTKKAILFDKDGTLIEYNTIWPDALREMIPLFREQFNVRNNISDEQLLENLGLSNQKVSDSTPIASGTTENIAKVLQESLKDTNPNVLKFVRSYFYNYTIKNKGEIKGIGQVKDLLTSLKEKGYTIGIVTADDYDSTIFTLKHLDIEDVVEFIATGDRYEAKPSAHAMQAFSSTIGIESSQALFVGDSCVDMQFGKHFRKGIAVLSGVGLKEELVQYTEHYYDTIHDIPYDYFFENNE